MQSRSNQARTDTESTPASPSEQRPDGDSGRSTRQTEQCSVVVVTYNHEAYIASCLTSVLEGSPGEIFVVDGGSSDDTREIVRTQFPDVTLIEADHNPGYGECNNIGVAQASGEYVLVLNPDTHIEPGSIEALLQPLAEDEGPDVTTPKILQYDGSAINTCGNINHMTGLTFVQGFDDDPGEWDEETQLTGISGACFAMKRQDFEEIGGFDSSIFLYMEDAELSWRLSAFGNEIRFVPEAIVYHDYDDVEVPESKLGHLEEGRYTILKKYLDRRTAALLLPSLLMAEILSFGYAVLLGWSGLKHKLGAIRSGLEAEPEPVEVESETLVRALDSEIPVGQLGSSLPALTCQRIANLVFRANYRLIER